MRSDHQLKGVTRIRGPRIRLLEEPVEPASWPPVILSQEFPDALGRVVRLHEPERARRQLPPEASGFVLSGLERIPDPLQLGLDPQRHRLRFARARPATIQAIRA